MWKWMLGWMGDQLGLDAEPGCLGMCAWVRLSRVQGLDCGGSGEVQGRFSRGVRSAVTITKDLATLLLTYKTTDCVRCPRPCYA